MPRDLAVLQFRAPGGANLDTTKVRPSPEDPTTVDVSVKIDECFSIGKARVKRKWRRGNGTLTEMLEAALDLDCKQDTIDGGNYELEEDSIEWPDGIKTQLNPIDPYFLGLRNRPGASIFEIQHMHLKGGAETTVPCTLVTAFFLVEGARHFVDGSGLRMNGSLDEDDEGGPDLSPRGGGGGKYGKKRRGRFDDDVSSCMDCDDSADDGGGGKMPASPRKKAPAAAAAAGLGGIGLASLLAAVAIGINVSKYFI